jgi:DNA topoisomerase IA
VLGGAEREDAGLQRVLCVAEKPSVAKAMALALSGGKQRIRCNTQGLAPMCRLHDFHCFFPPARGVCSVTVTSVLGHCHSLDFAGANHGDPANLFGAHVSKVAEDTTAEHGIEAHLAAAAAGCTYLFLWLDCDREGELSRFTCFAGANARILTPLCVPGENICFEVINICRAAGFFRCQYLCFLYQ